MIDEKHKLIFKDIVSAHSTDAIRSQINNATGMINKAFQVGGDEGLDILVLGVAMLNKAVCRFELLRQAEKGAELILNNKAE
ncbi:MAG: hypothetical protein R3E89_15555 [Thiolinea sp.]